MKNRYAFKMLLRSPVKTVLTVLLLAAAAFLLLDNLSSYAMQTETVKQAEEAVEGVLTVERSPVSNPRDGTRSSFLLTELGESYLTSNDYTYETLHHKALTEAEVKALEALPYIDAVDRRYMTAGISEDFVRLDGPMGNYGYMDRLVIEATVTGWYVNEVFQDDSILDTTDARNFTLEDVTVLAGDRKTLDQQLKALNGKARLIVATVPDNKIGRNNWVFLGKSVDSFAYDISRSLLDFIERGRRYLFVVRAPRYESVDSSSFGFFLGDDSLKNWWPYVTDVTDLQENYLETEDFAPLRELIQITNDDIRTFDVVYTGDMASIRRVSRQQLTPVRGRFLGPEDAGSPVCVVSETFLTSSGLSLGDSITLKLGNHLMEQYEPLGAVAVARSRYASAWEERSFTIVGTWRDSSDRRWQQQEYYNYYSVSSWQEQDPYWAYSTNAIFVPSTFLPESCDTESHLFRPAEVSFLVRDADNIGAFGEESLPLVEGMGLRYEWNDAGWPIISDKMAQTRRLTLMKLLIFTVASLLAVGLTLYLFLHRRRREYAILRALGTPRKGAAKALLLPLLALAAFSSLLGLLIAWLRSGAAVRQSAAEFAEAGLEAMPSAHRGVYLLGALSLLLVTFLMAGVYLRALGKRSPLALLQDSDHRKLKKAGQFPAEIGMEDLAHAAAVLAFPVTATGRPARGFLRRYVFRHIRRAGAKTLLALLLAALLVGAVGQLTVMRSRYAEMMDTVEVEAGFFNGLSLGKADNFIKSGLLRNPLYQKTFSEEEAELELSPTRLTFSNRLDSAVSDPVTWLEGWNEAVFDSACDLICVLPAPVMAELGVELGGQGAHRPAHQGNERHRPAPSGPPGGPPHNLGGNGSSAGSIPELLYRRGPGRYGGGGPHRLCPRGVLLLLQRLRYDPLFRFCNLHSQRLSRRGPGTANGRRDPVHCEKAAGVQHGHFRRGSYLPGISADRNAVPPDRGGGPHFGDAPARADDPSGTEGGGGASGPGLVEEADDPAADDGAGAPVPHGAHACHRRPVRGERPGLPGCDRRAAGVCDCPLRPLRGGFSGDFRVDFAKESHAPAAGERVKEGKSHVHPVHRKPQLHLSRRAEGCAALRQRRL
ncbi:MAG: FtsX-like permease family protein [Oscillospiraceae bacterium]|nr:FtsX-like permease family protein [Oscillospiraceae bacterium]